MHLYHSSYTFLCRRCTTYHNVKLPILFYVWRKTRTQGEDYISFFLSFLLSHSLFSSSTQTQSLRILPQKIHQHLTNWTTGKMSPNEGLRPELPRFFYSSVALRRGTSNQYTTNSISLLENSDLCESPVSLTEKKNTILTGIGIYKAEQVDHFWLLTSIFFFAPFSFPFAFFSSAGGAASASVISGQIFFWGVESVRSTSTSTRRM